MFENFFGNRFVAESLARMIDAGRIPQTLLLAGPEGVGKATLARRFAARLLAQCAPGAAEEIRKKIEQDDLSLPENRKILEEREKWPSEKRAEEPLFFSSHPDFVTFCPEGPLRQISIQQMRLARTRAQLRPLKGQWRVFLIDRMDRAGAQAADALLKTLEEPPPHLVLILTAENPFELPPTIRSRSVSFWMTPLSDAEMEEAARALGWKDAARRIALAGGCPGVAASMDLAEYEKRRAVALAMLESAAGTASFADWVKKSQALLASRTEKLAHCLKPLYALLEDILVLQAGGGRLRNEDVRPALEKLAARVSFEWVREAVALADAWDGLERRNVQKAAVADQFVVGLAEASRAARWS
ncbi:MAG: AAA family ATPase [Bryobacteraceae bacterium]|nr:AAA family ATPase [Bryobacteraceae bacterium]